jgi:hypothetical protein
MKPISTSFFAAVLSASLAVSASSSSAAPITNWAIDPSGAGTVVYSGLTTDSPVIGNGTSNNANSGIIDGSFSTLSLLDGQSIALSGSMTIVGAVAKSLGFQFGLLYEPGTVAIDDKGWAGYFANNTSQGVVNANHGNLRARDPNFETIWISGTNTTQLAVVPSAGNGTFSNGTYSFGMTVERVGADVKVSASILGTGTTVFTNSWGPVTVTAANLKTFNFNRIGIWSVAGLDADQITLSGIDVSVVPEPSSIVILGISIVSFVGFAYRRWR